MDLTSFSPESVLFWSGAGISVDGPTFGPVGRELTDRALVHYMKTGTSRVIERLYSQVAVANAGFRPRLETVLDALVDAHGIECLGEVLSDLLNAQPNSHHHFFAAHLALGGRHVTANFDTCIERAAHEESTPTANLLHFHGSLGLGDTDELEKLGARLRIIENGFDSAMRDRLDHLLGAARALVIVGYSGSDFFDATPYLLDRTEILRNVTVIWYEFANDPFEWCEAGRLRESGLLTALRSAGVPVYGVRGRLGDFLDEFRETWAMPRLGPPSEDGKRGLPWEPPLDRSEHDRETAAFNLYAAMGFRSGVIASAGRQPPTSPESWGRLADAYWGAGRYREAGDAWRRAFPGDDEYQQARRVEREGAVYWIRGEFRAAERVLWAGIKRWAHADLPAGPLAAAVLLETYGRVVEHMERSPETTILVRRSRRSFARDALRSLVDDLRGQEGVALRARFVNVLAYLDGVADQEMSNHVAAFDESEALHAWLNYRQGRLRQLIAHDPKSVRAADYERLIRDQAAIGAIADAARALLLPGAAQYASPRAFRHAFRRVEMSRWHRLRLLAGFTASYLLEFAKHPGTLATSKTRRRRLDAVVSACFT